MSEITQPGANGITAQAAKASIEADQRRQQEHDLVGARRDDRLLSTNLRSRRTTAAGRTGRPRSGPCASARRPDLAVGIEQEGDATAARPAAAGSAHDDQQVQPQRRRRMLQLSAWPTPPRCWCCARRQGASTRPWSRWRARSGWSGRSPRSGERTASRIAGLSRRSLASV